MCSPNDPITAGVFDPCPAFPACEHYPRACPVTAAVPDPRFRDQLAEALIEPTNRWYSREARQAIADALLPLIAAEVEARVQAELEEIADSIPRSDSEHEAKAMLRDRAAALDPS